MTGKILAHYRILEQIGAGGMGAVYRAEDLKLNRHVALKILPPEVASNPERLERFKREARAVAALNDPHIVTVYSVEEVDGVHFITMELVNGQPLNHCIPKDGYSEERFLQIAIPIAEALAFAHQQGIIHRDLKSANIMLDVSGRVKIIDFGLAKAVAAAAAPELDSGVATELLTMEGKVLGTPAYMSPEQIHGQKVDHRSDIFSLGVIFHEMLTGERPFKGESSVSIMSAILNNPPTTIADLKPHLPAELSRIVRHCLQKDPHDRFQTALDVRNELKELQADLKSGSATHSVSLPAAKSASAGKILLIFTGIAILALSGTLVFQWLRKDNTLQNASPSPVSSSSPATQSFRHLVPEQWSYDAAMEEWPAFSPDGTKLVYSKEVNGFKKLFIKSLKSRIEPEKITTGEWDDIQPAWFPDGTAIAFVRSNNSKGKIRPTDVWGGFYAQEGDIYILDLNDKDPKRIVAAGFNPTLNRDGILAYDAELDNKLRIWTCDRYGHEKRPVTSDKDSHGHMEPTWSPDGRFIVFRRQEGKYSAQLALLEVATGKTSILTENYYLSNPIWSPGADYIYFTANMSSGFNIWRMPINAEGERQGNFEPMTFGPGRDMYPALSPDGNSLAYTILSWNSDIWLIPMDAENGTVSGSPQALIESSREDTRASFSRDETKIVFTSDRNRHMNLFVASFDSDNGVAGEPVQVTFGPGGDYQAFWSGDGTNIVFFSRRTGSEDLWRISIDENLQPVGEPVQLTDYPGQDINPIYSPDGRHIAWMSDRSGALEVWVMKADGSDPLLLSHTGTGGHYAPWYDNESVVYLSTGGAWRAFIDGRKPEQIMATAGGHMSFSPNRKWVADNNHIAILVFPLAITVTREQRQPVHAFPDSSIGVDYTIWSPSGKWIIFDRNIAEGGDIFMLTGVDLGLRHGAGPQGSPSPPGSASNRSSHHVVHRLTAAPAPTPGNAIGSL